MAVQNNPKTPMASQEQTNKDIDQFGKDLKDGNFDKARKEDMDKILKDLGLDKNSDIAKDLEKIVEDKEQGKDVTADKAQMDKDFEKLINSVGTDEA